MDRFNKKCGTPYIAFVSVILREYLIRNFKLFIFHTLVIINSKNPFNLDLYGRVKVVKKLILLMSRSKVIDTFSRTIIIFARQSI